MARRKELTPEEAERKELVDGFLKSAAVKDPAELKVLIKEMMRQVVESSLEAELHKAIG